MKSCIILMISGCGLFFGITPSILAQPPFPDHQQYYQPLNQNTPPGVAGQWAGALGRANQHYFQPVQFRLPAQGEVTFYQPGRTPQTLSSPAQAGFLVGPLYRFKISNMPEYPGLELYPTIELVDRLHPPAHLKQKYPLPVELTEQDIALAAEDQLVTKIIYIEQPDVAVPRQAEDRIHEETLSQSKNLMTEADLRGRPALILRIGGRIPSQQELTNPHITPLPPIEFLNR